MDTLTPTPQPAPLPGPWVACRACRGSGLWKGRSGYPCNLCMGSGDGRIRNHTVPWIDAEGVLRGAKRAGNGHDTDEDSDDMPMPVVVTPAQKTAAERLAETLAELAGNASVNEEQVREIIRSEFQDSGNALADLVTDTKAKLDELIAGAPRILEVRVGDHSGQMPAIRHKVTEDLLLVVAQEKPVLCAYVVGPAGSGKTTAAEQVAVALGLDFYMQGALAGSHEISGFVNAHGHYQSTPFRQAYEHGGLILLDEIDGCVDPAALLTVNAALANGYMAFPDQPTPIKRHARFRCVAAANTFGMGADRRYIGRTQLDAASLDRFAFVDWPYDETLERQLAGDNDWTTFVQNARRAAKDMDIVISPRASINGNAMLAAGMRRDKVEKMFIWRGMTEAEIARVRGAM